LIDIHSHILWGLDDGAESCQESLAMLNQAAETGTTEIVATPHANDQYFYDEELVSQRISELSAASKGALRIHRGCDFHLSFENIQQALAQPSRYVIAGGPYLLVEFPNACVQGFGPALGKLLDSGLIPIMTHPERHPDLQRINAEFLRWVQMGCFIQVTGQSLLGRFGKLAEESAWEMVKRGLVHFVASDAHGTTDRTPRLDHAFSAVSARFGAESADLLFVSNPSAAIAGEAISGGVAKRRRWHWLSQ
jgi:protein-tyrosine phosphatase